MLYVEQLRASSSLQSMILRQMEQPHTQLYSMKQALEWLIQVCSAGLLDCPNGPAAYPSLSLGATPVRLTHNLLSSYPCGAHGAHDTRDLLTHTGLMTLAT
jgi:hypothetical protein